MKRENGKNDDKNILACFASTLFTFSYFHFRYSASPLKIFVAGQPTMYDSELEQLCHDQIRSQQRPYKK